VIERDGGVRAKRGNLSWFILNEPQEPSGDSDCRPRPELLISGSRILPRGREQGFARCHI
jgi:hypothetical protein